MTDHGGAASPRTDPLPDGLRRDLIRAIAGLDGYANPNTARGDYWDKRLALVFEVVQPYLAAQEAPAPEGLREPPVWYGLREALEAQAKGDITDGFRRGIEFAAAFVGAWLSSPNSDPAKRRFRATPPTPAEPPRPRGRSLVCSIAKHHECDGNAPNGPAGVGSPCVCSCHVRAEARPPEGLDAERLARAIRRHDHRGSGGLAIRADHLSFHFTSECDVLIAAEYVRLSAGAATVGNRPDVATPRVAKATRGAKGAR